MSGGGPREPADATPGDTAGASGARSLNAVVLGGSSFVAPYLLRRLAASGASGVVTSRRPDPASAGLPVGFESAALDPAAPADWRAPPGSVVFSLLPLPALMPLLPALEDAAQIVALGTSGVHYKQDSSDPRERTQIRAMVEAGTALEAACAGSGAAWTQLQPTLVYAPWQDHNVSAIARFIRRFGFFPVALPARGLRQPVHADDVAQAAVAAAGNPRAYDRAFILAGGETLAYRAMVARVFEALGRRPVILALPGGLLRLGLRVFGRLFGFTYSSALFDRMNNDAVFETAEAREALGFAPRDFQPDFGPGGAGQQR